MRQLLVSEIQMDYVVLPKGTLERKYTLTFPSVDHPARNMDVMPFALATIWDRKVKAILRVLEWFQCRI